MGSNHAHGFKYFFIFFLGASEIFIRARNSNPKKEHTVLIIYRQNTKSKNLTFKCLGLVLGVRVREMSHFHDEKFAFFYFEVRATFLKIFVGISDNILKKFGCLFVASRKRWWRSARTAAASIPTNFVRNP